MTDSATLERIRRVEETPLQDLVAVSLDDIEVQMDHLLGPQTTIDALYTRWETQQWAVSELDLEPDKKHWRSLQPGLQAQIRNGMTAFFVGEQAVTDTLGPILHAAPREDERVFLATQVADEARHSVFFHRYFNEVLEIRGSLPETLAGLRRHTVGGFRRIFDGFLVRSVEKVRVEPADLTAWVEAVTTYHMVVEGYLAITGQRALLRQFKGAGILPGFVAGFMAVTRDESRHIGFGVLALRRRVTENPEMARVIARQVLELLEPAVHVLVAPDRRLPVEDPNDVPPAFRINPVEARDFAVDSLTKRLRLAGLSEAALSEIADAMRHHYESAWALYESNHGVRHPVRFWQEGSVGRPA